MDNEVQTEDDKQAVAAFAEGFDSTEGGAPAAASPAPAVAETPVVQPAEKTGEEGAPQDAQAAPVETTTPVKPEYVQITKEEHAILTGAAAKVATIEKGYNSLQGTVGNIKQIVSKMEAATPQGEAVQISDEMFAEMAEEFPTLAGQIRTVLEKALKGKTGTGAAATVDPEAMKQAVRGEATQQAIEVLEEDHPTWRGIVSKLDIEGKIDTSTPYRVWLAKQPAEYQTRINETHNPIVVSRSIDKFLADQAKVPAAPPPPPKKKDDTTPRRDRIKDAIPLRGDGGAPPPSNQAPDDFREGFEKG